MTLNKLEIIKSFNEKFDREEVLYNVMVYKFMLQQGKYIRTGGDPCFERTNDFEKAYARYLEALEHAPEPTSKTGPFNLIQIEEIEIIDNEAYNKPLLGYIYSELDPNIKIEW